MLRALPNAGNVSLIDNTLRAYDDFLTAQLLYPVDYFQKPCDTHRRD